MPRLFKDWGKLHDSAPRIQVLLTAAQALQDGVVTSPFDAMHLSEALHRGTALATADEALWKTRFPAERF